MRTTSSNFTTYGIPTFLLLLLLLMTLFFHNPKNHHCIGVAAFSTPFPSRHAESSLQRKEATPYDNPYLFQAYNESMTEVLSFFRIMQKNDKPCDLEVAKRYLFTPRRLINPHDSSCLTEKDDFHKYITVKKEHFLNTFGMENHQLSLVLRSLSYLGDYCARKRISAPLHVAWDKMKECGSRPRENALSTYLYIFSSFPLEIGSEGDITETTTGSGSTTISTTTAGYNPKDVSGEVAFYHDMIYKPTENTVSIRIKSLVEQGCTEEAEELLWKLESEVTQTTATGAQSGKQKSSKRDGSGGDCHLLRLRTCLPVLKSYCQQDGDISQGLRLFHKMMSAPSVHLESETYVLVLSSLARRGHFRQDSEPIENIQDLGYSETRGASLFDAIANEMAKDVLEITSASAKDLRNALVAGYAAAPLHKMAVRNLSEVPYDCDMTPWIEPAVQDELVANRIRIGTNSTVCPRTNATLRLILLDDHQRQQMHDALLRMADSQFDAYETKLQTKGNKPSRLSLEENYAGKHLEGFAQWLNDRDGEPFTAIIDGANVAYYGLGCINYHQLKLMVTTLERMGENPLVIIPQKYTQRKFHLRQGYVQELTDEQMEIIKDLENNGKLYEVPHRCLDDYYWMLSSVSPQTKTRNGAILDVLPDNESGRFPGTRPILISNDQMRDHKLELLEPKLFRRWVSSHIVNYHFTPFLNDLKEDREIEFSPADFTSREIQGNPCGCSDDIGDGAIAWHFPVSDWDKNDRFCIRIPRTKI